MTTAAHNIPVPGPRHEVREVHTKATFLHFKRLMLMTGLTQYSSGSVYNNQDLVISGTNLLISVTKLLPLYTSLKIVID